MLQQLFPLPVFCHSDILRSEHDFIDHMIFENLVIRILEYITDLPANIATVFSAMSLPP